ncbi:MAG: ATP-binding protein [Gilvibacter sp.]
MELVKDTAIDKALSYLYELIAWRLQNPLGDFTTEAPQFELTSIEESNLGKYIASCDLDPEEVVALLLALAPNTNPSLLINAVTDIYPNGAELPEFGGAKGKNHRGILPTAETLQFLVAGLHTNKRLCLMDMFARAHVFFKKSVLYLEVVSQGEPSMSGKIILTDEALAEIATGVPPLPDLSAHFPAELLETTLSWEDLILEDTTLSHIRDLETWLSFNDILLHQWQMKGRIKPGYRVLLHGPPGTGKTMTASLLGKYTNRPVYRIDLSTVVSKYIGETEKNLASLFDRAAHKNWILFFDEADSIFGKRTNVRDAHDKYANQEVSYLLQRIEAHPGLVLLATNFKDNIDDAFTRRFQSIIEFRMPAAQERLRLWELNMPKQMTLAAEVDMQSISRKFELSGSNITNIIQYSALQMLKTKAEHLSLEILMDGIKKEYQKENKMF